MTEGEQGRSRGADIEILEYRLAQAESALKCHTSEMRALNAKMVQFRVDEDAKERRQLMWGISTLGAVVMTLGALLWNYKSVIFK